MSNITTKIENARLRLGLVKRPAGLVSLRLSARFDEANSPRTEAELGLYADSLQNGVGRLDKEELARALALAGASLSIEAGDGVVTFSLEVVEEGLKKALFIFSELIQSPTFPAPKHRQSVRIAQNELEIYSEAASARAHDELRNNVFAAADQRYRYRPKQLAAALAEVKRADVLSRHKLMRQSPWTLTVSGSEGAMMAVVKKVSALQLPEVGGKKKMTAPLAQPPLNKSLLTTLSLPSKQNIEISLGAPLALLVTDPEYPAWEMALAVLGLPGGFAGRLMSIVREKQGLTYGIYARTEGVEKDEVGYWRISTFFTPKDVMAGLRSTLYELKRLKDKGITADELTRFKIILVTRQNLVFDSDRQTLSLVHRLLRQGFSYEEYLTLAAKFKKLTLSEVNAVINKYLDPGRLIISAAGPVDGVEKELAALLENK